MPEPGARRKGEGGSVNEGGSGGESWCALQSHPFSSWCTRQLHAGRPEQGALGKGAEKVKKTKEGGNEMEDGGGGEITRKPGGESRLWGRRARDGRAEKWVKGRGQWGRGQWTGGGGGKEELG